MDNILFNNLSPDEIVALVSVFSISVGNSLSDEELLVLGNFMVSAGVGLLIIVTQRALLKNQESNTGPDTQVQIQELKKEIQQLKKMLNSQI
jgi:hypothetical protein